METPLDRIIQNLEDLPIWLELLGEDIIASPEVGELMRDLNREQLDAGIRADGSEITPSYTDYTLLAKGRKGQPTDRVTLRDTGEFYADMRTEIRQSEVVVENVNEKARALRAKYNSPGGDILGLTDRAVDYVQDFARPKFEEGIRFTILPQLLQR